MANHLTPDQVARFAQRTLSPADFLVLDEHLATCESCRQAVSDPNKLQSAYEYLRQDLLSQAELGLAHISYEQLEAYVDASLEPADREVVDSHVELCQICRDELIDLQKFRSSLELPDVAWRSSHEEPLTLYASADEHYTAPLSGSQGASQNRHKLGGPGPYTSDSAAQTTPNEISFRQRLTNFWRYPSYMVAVSAVAAVVLIAVWLLPVSRHSNVPNNAHQTQGSQPQTGTPPPISAYTQLARQELHLPPELNALIGKRETLLGGPSQGSSFELFTPVGTFVEDAQPLFRWEALRGASRYQVTVVDSELREVLRSPEISNPNWKADRALERGKVYQWQVTAFRNSEQIVAPAPPAPEAKFEIVSQAQADELAQLRLTHASNSFALGYAYANAGVLDRAESELRLVPASDANYELAQKFITQIEAQRHPTNKVK